MINSFAGEYAFLSNMYPCKIIYKELEFPSSEHLYQWLKIPNTQEGQWWRDKIREAVHGKVAKKLANNPKCPKVDKFYEFDHIKLDRMKLAVYLKFTQNEDLAELLRETGDEELIEGNTWNDTFWGVCNGIGQNHLGKILMKMREIIWEE